MWRGLHSRIRGADLPLSLARASKRLKLLWITPRHLEERRMPRKKAPSMGGRLGNLVPLAILTGYVAYVLTDRFEDHHARKKELDSKRAENKGK